MSIRTHTRRPATRGTVNRFTNIVAGVTGEWLGWSPIGWSLDLAVHGIAVRQSRPVRSSQTHEGAGHDEGDHPDRIRGAKQGPEDR